MKTFINFTHLILMTLVYLASLVGGMLGIMKLFIWLISFIYPSYATIENVTIEEIIVYIVSVVIVCELYNRIQNGQDAISVPFKNYIDHE